MTGQFVEVAVDIEEGPETVAQTNPEENGPEETAPHETSPEDELDPEVLAQLREEMRRLTVAQYLEAVLHSLSMLAVRRLGLNEKTDDLRDLGQSRLAIDAFKGLVDLLGEAVPPDEIRMHREVLSQLQMAYAAVCAHPDRAADQEHSEDVEG